MHDWPLAHRDHGFRRWLAVSQCNVWSFGVVVVPSSFDDELGLLQGLDDFSVQNFIPHSPVEDFTVSVLPRGSRLDSAVLARQF